MWWYIHFLHHPCLYLRLLIAQALTDEIQITNPRLPQCNILLLLFLRIHYYANF
jgi:hypothetical protein